MGQSLGDLVKEGSDFLKGMGRVEHVEFEIPMEEGFGREKRCASIRFHGGEARVYIGDTLIKEKSMWKGSQEQLPNKLADFKEDLMQCSHLSATYMPAHLHRGTNKIEYNEDLVVIAKRKPVFWD